MPNSRIILFMLIAASLFSMPACCRNDNLQDGDDKILASINNYKLTVADFKSESRNLLAGNYSDAGFEKAKEGLLDDMITKKLLILEAQKQNFDKDRAFREEIERYWEQALLKLLYKKKEQEMLSKIKAEEEESPSGQNLYERNKKTREAINSWIEELRSRADIRKYEENLKEVKQ